MALTLYYTPSSFFSQRGLLALEEKAVPFRKHIISIHGGEALEPWYMRIQPKGTVPTLTHGDVIQSDSKDIILYMDEITPHAPKFLPDPSTPGGERVAYFEKLMQPINVGLITYGSACHRHLTHDCKLPEKMTLQGASKMLEETKANTQKMADRHPELRHLYLAKLKVTKDRDLTNEDALIAALKDCDAVMNEVEQELAKKWQGRQDNLTDTDPWLCCDHFTIADIYLSTLLHRLFMAGQVKRFWGDGKRPYIAAYYARVQQRKSFKAACGEANNIFKSMVLPKIKYQIKKAMPRVVGVTMVMAVAAFAVYVQYKGLPSWWPKNLKLPN